MVFYDADDYDSKNPKKIIGVKKRLKTFQYKTFNELSSFLFCLIKYQNCTTNYEGDKDFFGTSSEQVNIQKKRFLEVFSYWAVKFESDEEYLICIIEENLPLLTNHFK